MELIEFDLILLTFKLNSDLSIYMLPHSAPPNMDHYLCLTIHLFHKPYPWPTFQVVVRLSFKTL